MPPRTIEELLPTGTFVNIKLDSKFHDQQTDKSIPGKIVSIEMEDFEESEKTRSLEHYFFYYVRFSDGFSDYYRPIDLEPITPTNKILSASLLEAD